MNEEMKIVQVTKSKNNVNFIRRIVLPKEWADELNIEDNVMLKYDKENNRIIIEKFEA